MRVTFDDREYRSTCTCDLRLTADQISEERKHAVGEHNKDDRDKNLVASSTDRHRAARLTSLDREPGIEMKDVHATET